MTESILRFIAKRQEAGQTTALATIIHTKGSTPCKAGTKMLICPDGSIFGTIGSGCAEAEVKIKSLTVLESRVACTAFIWLLDDDAAQSGMVCGGVMDVFIQVV